MVKDISRFYMGEYSINDPNAREVLKNFEKDNDLSYFSYNRNNDLDEDVSDLLKEFNLD